MPAQQGQARPHILVVEDDPLVSAMIRDALGYAGFEVTTVIAGEDALSLAMMEVPIDLVLTDIELAGPMDGWELAELLREMRGSSLPIIYASAHATGTQMRVGNSLFLSKPYSPLALCGMIRELVAPVVHKPDIAPASHRVIQLDERRALLRA